jgi:hypothetical protein
MIVYVFCFQKEFKCELNAIPQNYIATLSRVVENKNGYTANGCNTVEEVVSKYSGFCNKFLRCAIEILKGSKDTKDIEEIMMIVNMGMYMYNAPIDAEIQCN